MLNLDQQAAIQSQVIVREGVKVKDAKAVENLITKTLGVLQEQGVYAMMLFLFSRTSDEEKIAPHICAPLYVLLRQLPVFQDNTDLAGFDKNTTAEPVLQFYAQAVCNNLDTLLLVKDLYEQTLIYARYGAKAAGKGAGQAQPEAGQ
jgi:hypothetical protein